MLKTDASACKGRMQHLKSGCGSKYMSLHIWLKLHELGKMHGNDTEQYRTLLGRTIRHLKQIWIAESWLQLCVHKGASYVWLKIYELGTPKDYRHLGNDASASKERMRHPYCGCLALPAMTT